MMGKCQSASASSASALTNDEDEVSDYEADICLKLTANSSTSGDDGGSNLGTLSVISEEGILLNILGYVSDAPFELNAGENSNGRAPTDAHATLTHILPLVSKLFHRLVRGNDLFWRAALLRLLDNEQPSLWEEGLRRVCFDSQADQIREHISQIKQSRRRGKRTKDNELQRRVGDPQSAEMLRPNQSPSASFHTATQENSSKGEILLEQACEAMAKHLPRNHTSSASGIYQYLFQTILKRHIRFEGPVFAMSQSIRIGDAYGLHFFEPRYRLLISEVMRNYPVSARRGEEIKPMLSGIYPYLEGEPGLLKGADALKLSVLKLLEQESMLRKHHMPTFIHAHRNLRRDSPATIVQVRRCGIHPDGSADVLLEPVGYIYVDQVWERPGTGHLLEASGVRMGFDACQAYEMWSNMSRYGMGDGRGFQNMLPIP
mmetsp:Transcript_24508/g.58238  ORF Transcript_24508/g.58238 Transcript_24508/m.58238 type:complete len:431 (+) Transcript_24508:100-1392(+)